MESTIIRDAFTRTQEVFISVRKLMKEHKTTATESEPYSTKYKIIEILKDLEEELSLSFADLKVEDDLVSIILASIHLNRGLLHSDTEELKAAEQQFIKCMELLKGMEKNPKAVIPLINASNQLGLIWLQWCEPTVAKKVLEEAEQIYKEYKAQENDYIEPINLIALLEVEPTEEDLNSKDEFENTHTLTLFYLAQSHRALKDHHMSAVYCHMTLVRQLENADGKGDLDHVDWALNAATLSQYLMEVNGFKQARHYLAASSHILKKAEEILTNKYKDPEESEASKAEWEHFRHRSADIARCWAKYGILLMMLSKNRLIEKAEKDELSDEEDEAPPIENEESIRNMHFDVLEKEIESTENEITDKYLLDFNDARPVFLNAQKWLDKAKAYYTLEDHASDYVAITQDYSLAYKYLAFFEENEDRQARMHKRRIDLLQGVIKELNPQYYRAVCREIWLELGETYSVIKDIKIDRMQSEEKTTAHALVKINSLTWNSIRNYQAYLDSIDNHKPDDPTLKLPEDIENSVLMVYFQIGRLHHKLNVPDKKLKIENIEASIKAYRYLVDYGKKYPKSVESWNEKYTLCGELLILLTSQVKKLKQELIE